MKRENIFISVLIIIIFVFTPFVWFHIRDDKIEANVLKILSLLQNASKEQKYSEVQCNRIKSGISHDSVNQVLWGGGCCKLRGEINGMVFK